MTAESEHDPAALLALTSGTLTWEEAMAEIGRAQRRARPRHRPREGRMMDGGKGIFPEPNVDTPRLKEY